MDEFGGDLDQDEFAQDYLNNDTNILTLENDVPNSEFTETGTLMDDNPDARYDDEDDTALEVCCSCPVDPVVDRSHCEPTQGKSSPRCSLSLSGSLRLRLGIERLRQ